MTDTATTTNTPRMDLAHRAKEALDGINRKKESEDFRRGNIGAGLLYAGQGIAERLMVPDNPGRVTEHEADILGEIAANHVHGVGDLLAQVYAQGLVGTPLVGAPLQKGRQF
jgi:hypothetical protein